MNLKELARKAISTLFLSMLCLVAFAQGRQQVCERRNRRTYDWCKRLGKRND